MRLSFRAVFLSTPSARRATSGVSGFCAALALISIHALREEGDPLFLPLGAVVQHISIHALREEGDLETNALPIELRISIHALREEGDSMICFAGISFILISIHALREEGDVKAAVNAVFNRVFLSTPSARRATSPGR